MFFIFRIAPVLLLAMLASCGGPPARTPRNTPPLLPMPDLNERAGARIWDQLRQFHRYRDACTQAVARAQGWKVSRLEDTSPSPGCGLRNALRVQESYIRISREVDIGCPMAAALHLWMREHVRPAAKLYLGSDVRSIETFGTYACRTRNGRQGARLSEHASANAMDIAGVTLADGRRLRVIDYAKMSESERDFIASIRSGACRKFSVVLGPGSDGHHEDHIHVDLGQWRLCK